MKLKNKILSLSLATLVGVQSTAVAASFPGTSNYGGSGVLENALYNHTPAASFQVKDSNGNTVKTMYYSGGYYFRFNNDTTPQPLWAFSPPEIEAGCNGFNLKGMFMSLLGLDQFGAMLQNAGTSLAWGVAVGLIYSLPGVASVFKMINQWAKDIQKLLSMSCQAGIAIGQAVAKKMGDAVGYDKEEVEKNLTFGLDADAVSKTAQDKLPGLIKDGLGLDGVNFDWDSGFSFGGGNEQSQQKKKDAVSAPLGKIFGDFSVGGSIYYDFLQKSPTSLDAIKAAVKNETSPMFYRTIQLDYSSGSGTFNSAEVLEESITNMQSKLPSPIEKVSFGMKVFSYSLFYNFIGDLGYTKATAETVINEIGKDFICSSANDLPAPASAGCNADQNVHDKNLFEALKDPSFSVKVSPVGVITPPTGTQLKNLVLLGKSQDTIEVIKKLKKPEFLIIGAKEKDQNANSFTVTPTEPTSPDTFFGTKEFPGAEVISKCSLYKSLTGIINESFIEDLKSTGINGLTCDTVPTIIFPGIAIYADILYKSLDSEISDGLSLIKDVNSYLTAKSILNQMSGHLAIYRAGTPKMLDKVQIGNVGELSRKQYNPQVQSSEITNKMKDFAKVIEEAKAELEKDFPKAQEGVAGLQTYFNNLQKKIQERASKQQQN